MLAISNLEVVYHSVVRVLNGVSLAVPQGSVFALLGPNGAGKTTLLRAITGMLSIHEGAVTKGAVAVGGDAVVGLSPGEIVARGVAQVMEGRRVCADLSVRDNLLAGARGRTSQQAEQDLERFYARFPILGERRAGQAGYLSGGEQQMLAIARALMSHPKLLLLDEPSLGLAHKVVADVAALIREINADGVTILLVEQNAGVALGLADRAAVLENGRIVVDGTVDEIRADKDIQEFYLGMGGDGHKSYRHVKHYRRRKRWLS